jgi:hypothetical protein
MPKDRDEDGQYVRTVAEADIVTAIRASDDPVATASGVAERVGCSRETARDKLAALHETGTVAKRTVGARAVVWWLSDEETTNETAAAGEIVIECDNCGREETYPRTTCQGCGSETTSIDDDWRNLSWDGPPTTADDRRVGNGLCEACVAPLLDEAKEPARERGRIPCRHPEHNTHELHGQALDECRNQGYVPFTDEEMSHLRAAYRSVRTHVCPDCGATRENHSMAGENTDDGTLQQPDLEAGPNFALGEYQFTSPYGEETMMPGLECRECGWGGPEESLNFRKQ